MHFQFRGTKGRLRNLGSVVDMRRIPLIICQDIRNICRPDTMCCRMWLHGDELGEAAVETTFRYAPAWRCQVQGSPLPMDDELMSRGSLPSTSRAIRITRIMPYFLPLLQQPIKG